MEDFKKDIDSNTIIVGNSKTPLLKMAGSSKQNINTDIAALHNVLDQINLTDIYRTFHHKEKNTHSFQKHSGTFSKIDHMIEHKTSLNKFKKTEIITNIYSDHSGLKLETSSTKTTKTV